MENQKVKNNFSVSIYDAFGRSINNNQFTQQLSKPDTIEINNRYYFITTNRSILSYMYINYGLVQVLIDQPVDDAFRGGIELRSKQLNEEDLFKLYGLIKSSNLIKQVKQLAKWTRLYGGGGLVVNTIGKASKPINIEAINDKTPIEFYAADLWELSQNTTSMYGEEKPYLKEFEAESFFFYGNELDASRVIKSKNKEAPAFLRPILRGWGMSEVERFVRDLNAKLKADTLIFELLDEAKVDIMKIKDFNDSMIDASGAGLLQSRIQTAMQIKNFQNALVMDKDDDFEQKQISFTGLAEMSAENRINIASAMRMPLTKIFGISSAGFNAGEDEIENYNSMIESEIRGEYDNVILQAVSLLCKKELGFVPDDLEIVYKPLRTLKATEEEEVKDKKMNRLWGLYDRGVINAKELQEQINIANLCPNKINITDNDFPLPPLEQPTLSLKEEDISKSNKIKNSKRIFKWLSN